MPGWSLWLVPAQGSQVDRNVAKLISTTVPSVLPALGNVPNFAPHLTITSQVPPGRVKDKPQEWLDALDLSKINTVHVRFESLESEDKFFKRLIIRCETDPALLELAVQCRAQGVESGDETKARKWIEDYDPHCSLA